MIALSSIRCNSLSLTTNQGEYGKAFFAKLFCASKKATVSRAFAKRAPFLLLLSGTKEVIQELDATTPHLYYI